MEQNTKIHQIYTELNTCPLSGLSLGIFTCWNESHSSLNRKADQKCVLLGHRDLHMTLLTNKF